MLRPILTIICLVLTLLDLIQKLSSPSHLQTPNLKLHRVDNEPYTLWWGDKGENANSTGHAGTSNDVKKAAILGWVVYTAGPRAFPISNGKPNLASAPSAAKS